MLVHASPELGVIMQRTSDRALSALRKWAVLLDSAFQVPGTQMRFGIDPIVGLIPGAGDLVTGSSR